MKKDALKSIIVLTSICLVIAVAMAITNYITYPIIREQQEKAEKEALFIVLPDAEDFNKIELSNIPQTVSAVYADIGGTGYAIILSAKGYDSSKPMSVVVGISIEGKITKCHVISCNGETSGIGTKVSESKFLDLFSDKDVNLNGVDTISGATISSSAFIEATKDAFIVYDMIKGGEGK